jgi:hypothetical protein
MGYSARYHAASLAAVFLALAVGILVGIGFGNSPRKSLERSLRDDLKNARSDADRLGIELNHERDFGRRAYPALSGGRLNGDRVGIVAIGNLPADVSSDIEDALQPTGGRLESVAVVRMPPGITRKGKALDAYAEEAGRQLVLGGRLLRRTRDRLLSRASGKFNGLDDVILVRDLPDDMKGSEAKSAARLEAGLVNGIHSVGRPVVAVERTDTDPSSVKFFDAHRVSTVDDLDLISGKVAMVFSLIGAEGNFGVKDTADRLLPELLVSSRSG